MESEKSAARRDGARLPGAACRRCAQGGRSERRGEGRAAAGGKSGRELGHLALELGDADAIDDVAADFGPAHDAGAIDDEHGRERVVLTKLADAERGGEAQVLVGDKRELEAVLGRKLRLLSRAVGSDGDDAATAGLKLCEVILQLTELPTAPGSPVPAVKDDSGRHRGQPGHGRRGGADGERLIAGGQLLAAHAGGEGFGNLLTRRGGGTAGRVEQNRKEQSGNNSANAHRNLHPVHREPAAAGYDVGPV